MRGWRSCGASPASTGDIAKAVQSSRHHRRNRAGNPSAAHGRGACPTPGLAPWSRGASPASPRHVARTVPAAWHRRHNRVGNPLAARRCGACPTPDFHGGHVGQAPPPRGILRGRFRPVGTVATTAQAIRWRHVGVGLAPHRAFHGGHAGQAPHLQAILRRPFSPVCPVAATAQAILRRHVGVGLAPHRTSTVVMWGKPRLPAGCCEGGSGRSAPSPQPRRQSFGGAWGWGLPHTGLPTRSCGASPASPGVLRERTEPQPQPQPQPLQRYGPGPRQTSSPRRYTYITVTTWRASPMDCSSGASGGSRRHLLEPRLSATSAGQTIR